MTDDELQAVLDIQKEMGAFKTQFRREVAAMIQTLKDYHRKRCQAFIAYAHKAKQLATLTAIPEQRFEQICDISQYCCIRVVAIWDEINSIFKVAFDNIDFVIDSEIPDEEFDFSEIKPSNRLDLIERNLNQIGNETWMTHVKLLPEVKARMLWDETIYKIERLRDLYLKPNKASESFHLYLKLKRHLNSMSDVRDARRVVTSHNTRLRRMTENLIRVLPVRDAQRFCLIRH